MAAVHDNLPFVDHGSPRLVGPLPISIAEAWWQEQNLVDVRQSTQMHSLV